MLTVGVAFFTCCQQKSPILPINKMKVVLWDMVSADEFSKQLQTKDSLFLLKKHHISFYNQVCSLHQISKDDFFKSYNYYQANPIDMKVLLDSTVAYGTRKRDTLNKKQTIKF